MVLPRALSRIHFERHHLSTLECDSSKLGDGQICLRGYFSMEADESISLTELESFLKHVRFNLANCNGDVAV